MPGMLIILSLVTMVTKLIPHNKMADNIGTETPVMSNSTPHELISYATTALSSFSAKEHSADVHIHAFLQEKTIFKDKKVFITEVFAGCVRFDSLLKVVVDGFFASDGKALSKSDSSLYYVISYLVIFRLEELGMKQFKRLVSSQPTRKMLKFLQFFFNEANLYGWIKSEWYKTYDSTFVDTTIISQLKRCEEEMNEFIEEYLVAKDSHTLPQSNDYKIPTTEVKPFKLTNPKPRRIPTPEKIPTMKTHKPVPQSTYVPPRESETAKMNRETLKLRAEKKLRDSQQSKFSCASTEKSLKTKIVIMQILEEREAKLRHVKVKPKPFPSSIMNQSQPTKLNAATILREGARVQKATENEQKRLADLEAGNRDSYEFEKWQDDIKQRDHIEQLAEAKRKHLESKLSYEDAILARQNHIQETKEKVNQLKEQYDEIMAEYFSRREEEKRNMRKLVEEVMKGHDSAREAKVKLQLMKQKIVQQVERESQELMTRALEEAEREMKQKVELIQQIRAMESVPVIRKKFVDLTETSGQGLLAEMSVIELRERLSLMKLTNEEEREKKRKEIAAAKEAKDKTLAETLETISRYKSERDHISVRKEQQRSNSHLRNSFEDEKLQELQLQLELKRKAREKSRQDVSMKNNTCPKSKAKSESMTKEAALETLLRTTIVSSKS